MPDPEVSESNIHSYFKPFSKKSVAVPPVAAQWFRTLSLNGCRGAHVAVLNVEWHRIAGYIYICIIAGLE